MFRRFYRLFFRVVVSPASDSRNINLPTFIYSSLVWLLNIIEVILFFSCLVFPVYFFVRLLCTASGCFSQAGFFSLSLTFGTDPQELGLIQQSLFLPRCTVFWQVQRGEMIFLCSGFIPGEVAVWLQLLQPWTKQWPDDLSCPRFSSCFGLGGISFCRCRFEDFEDIFKSEEQSEGSSETAAETSEWTKVWGSSPN